MKIFFALLFISFQVHAAEIVIKEMVRGSFIPLKADTVEAKAEAKAASIRSYEEGCKAWETQAKEQLGAEALYISCGPREDHLGGLGKAISTKVGNEIKKLDALGYRSYSEGSIIVSVQQEVNIFREGIRGESFPLLSTGYIPKVGFEGVATARISAEGSYKEACLNWKRKAKDMGARFLFASCESAHYVRGDSTGAYSSNIRLESKGGIYYFGTADEALILLGRE